MENKKIKETNDKQHEYLLDDKDQNKEKDVEKAKGEAAIMMLMMEDAKRRKQVDSRVKRMRLVMRFIVAIGIIAVICALPLANKMAARKGQSVKTSGGSKSEETVNTIDASIEAEIVGSAYSTGKSGEVYTVRLTYVDSVGREKSLIVGKEITVCMEEKTEVKTGDVIKGRLIQFDSASDIWTFESDK